MECAKARGSFGDVEGWLWQPADRCADFVEGGEGEFVEDAILVARVAVLEGFCGAGDERCGAAVEPAERLGGEGGLVAGINASSISTS